MALCLLVVRYCRLGTLKQPDRVVTLGDFRNANTQCDLYRAAIYERISEVNTVANRSATINPSWSVVRGSSTLKLA